MNNALVSALQQLGCTAKEIKFYLANYDLGPATLAEISSRAKLQRATVYLIAEELDQKHLIFHDHQEYARRYTTVPPQDLIAKLQSKQRTIKKAELQITDDLVSLQARYGASDILPKVSVYQGEKGLRSVKADILKSSGEILLWTNQHAERSVFSKDEHRKFIDYRVKNNVAIRVLVVDNEEGREIVGIHPELLREARLLPHSIDFTTETYIYGNSIAMLDYNTDIVSVVIHNPSIARTQRELFEMTWAKSA